MATRWSQLSGGGRWVGRIVWQSWWLVLVQLVVQEMCLWKWTSKLIDPDGLMTLSIRCNKSPMGARVLWRPSDAFSDKRVKGGGRLIRKNIYKTWYILLFTWLALIWNGSSSQNGNQQHHDIRRRPISIANRRRLLSSSTTYPTSSWIVRRCHLNQLSFDRFRLTATIGSAPF